MIIHDVSQNTPEWMALRSGLPTASSFSKLVTSKGEPSKSMQGYAQELAGELYAGHPLNQWEGNQYTEYGHDTEEEAALSYAMRGIPIETIGFVTDDLQTYGCSPDRLAGDNGLLEIKCLPKQHIKTLLYFNKHGRVPPEYVVQPQGQMLITGKQWVDICFYSPDLPMLVVRQEPDEKIQNALKTQLLACIAERNLTLKILEEM